MVDVNKVKILPGADGTRLRLYPNQAIPSIKDGDPDYMKPKPVADVYTRVFDLSVEKDITDYSNVWNSAVKGHVMISAEERHWSETTQNFKIFLRWGDVYLEIPKTSEVMYGQRQY